MHARESFLLAMRYAAASVAVVTTDGKAGKAGITVSSVCSLSADPPSVLICVNQSSPVLNLIRENGCFCVNLLSAEQSHVADSFAGRIAHWRENRFLCAGWDVGGTGAPRLDGALANLDCILAQQMDYATHTILVGEARSIDVEPQSGLLYANRNYFQLGSQVQTRCQVAP